MATLNGRSLTDETQDQAPAIVAATQVVFIDAAVPDAQELLAGIAPGVVGVLLKPDEDGVEQIANWLSSHQVSDLAAVDIVAHGSDGAIKLGNGLLDANTIAEHQAALATIGAALKPGGAIQLFGCDVAQDATGVTFMQQLSQATGNAHIAAASHNVGAAAEGASWTLDVDVGSVAVANPFTAATLAAFPDVLSVTENQIFFSAWNGLGDAGNRVEQIGVNGSALVNGSTIDLGDASKAADSGLNATSSGVAADTALNRFFVAIDQATTGTRTSVIESGNINNPGSLTTLFTDSFENFEAFGSGPAEFAALGGFALDAQHGQLYFAQDAIDANGDPIAKDTGIYRIDVNTKVVTQVTPTANSLTNPLYLALDAKDNLLFFDDTALDGGPGFPAVNNLDVLNLTTGAITVLKSFTPTHPASFALQGLDVDAAHGKLYLTTRDPANPTDAGNAILSLSFQINGSGSTSITSTSTLYSGAGAFLPTDITVDPSHGIFYATGSNASVAGVFEGSLSGGTSLTSIVSTANLVSAGANPATTAPQLVLVTAPTVTTGGTVTAVTNGGSVTVDPTAAVADTSGQLTASASIVIVGDKTGDVLDLNNGSPLTFGDGDKISSSFNSAGTLTLTGNATAAEYQTAFDAVTFTTSSNDATPRTIDWTVSDGVVSSAIGTSTVEVHVLPTLNAGATATFNGGGPAATLDSGLTITDPSSTTLANATVTIGGFISGDTLTVGNAGGLSTSFNNGTLTLSGSASVATYQSALDSVQYSFNPTNGDPTGGSTHTSRSIAWVVNDGTTSGSASSTLNVVHVAPAVTAGASVVFPPNPVVLDSGLTVTDPDSGGNLIGATVSISAGFLSGDILAFSNQNGITGNYNAATGLLTLTGTASVASYQTALQSVTYSAGTDPTNGGTDKARTISWQVSDSVAPSAVETSSLAICFCAGTMIATPDGEVAVEQLKVGDHVLTLHGTSRPIRWIGTGQSLLAPGQRGGARPIIVRAGALGGNMPVRNLRVTKGHSLYLADVLIPVENLVNHRSILWDDQARSVVIYHVELDTHDVLIADGAPAESYRDDGNRRLFQNVNPAWDAPAPPPCAPIVTVGPVVAALWQAMLELAEPGPEILLTDDPDLHLLVDGARVVPSAVDGRCYAFDLDAVGAALRIVSRAAAPAELGLTHEQRRLGVAVERIVLRQPGMTLDLHAGSPLLCDGFHMFEADDNLRWTDGDAVLPAAVLAAFAGAPARVELHLGASTSYRRPDTLPTVDERPARAA